MTAGPIVDAVDPVSVTEALARSSARRSAAGRIAGSLFSILVSVGLILGLWQLFLEVFNVDSFVGKGPVEVWNYLTSDPDAASNRSVILDESWITLRDAFLGLVGGTAAAVIAALVFNVSRMTERTLMPIAMVLRSVPLVAMTPLIVLIFGRELLAVTIIAGIVTFFPTLVNVSLALRSTPDEAIDLCTAYGASPRTTLRKVQIPSALPALFASLRIAAPLSLIGALLAEWLATGDGLGYAILSSTTQFDYTGLWARVVAVTLYSLALYGLIGLAERRALDRFAAT